MRVYIRSNNQNNQEDEGKRNVYLLGTTSFLNDLSSDMLLPILPLFINSLGGGGIEIGIIGGLRDSISSILKVISGYIADKTGKKKGLVFSGYLVSSMFKTLIGFAKNWYHVLIFASFERVGKGLRTAPRDAIIADSMPKERGKGFGIHRSMDTFGAVLGSVLVLVLFWLLGLEFREIIFIAGGLSLLSLVPLFFVKEKGKRKMKRLRINLHSLPLSLRKFILISGLFYLANFSYMFFVLRAKGSWGTSAVEITAFPLALYILFNIFYASFALYFGKLSDKVGRKKIISAGYLLFALTSLGFSLFTSPIAFIILFALYGIVYAIIDGNQRAYVSDLSPPEIKATSLGTYHTIVGLVSLPASTIAGVLWSISPSYTFLYGFSVGLLASLLLMFSRI